MRRLRKMRRRTARFWRESCPFVGCRRRLTRGVLFLLAVGTVAWVKTDRDMIFWAREQIPYMERVKESDPVRAVDQDGMTLVKQGFTIRLDERKIHILQVEEGCEDRGATIDSGSNWRDRGHSLGILTIAVLVFKDIVYYNFL